MWSPEYPSELANFASKRDPDFSEMDQRRELAKDRFVEVGYTRDDVVERRMAEANREWSSGFAKHGVQLPASEVANYLTGLFEEMARVVAERDAAVALVTELREQEAKDHRYYDDGLIAIGERAESAERALSKLRAEHERVVGERDEANAKLLANNAEWSDAVKPIIGALQIALRRASK